MLRDGNDSPAKALIQSVYSAGCGATILADLLIRPVMERIGHGWLTGALDIYQEHRATHTVASSIHELIDRENRDREGSRPLALGAATEGDPYVLSSLQGFCGLLEAIDRFDLTHETKLATYATWWIRQATQQAVASGAYPVRLTPRHLHQLTQNQVPDHRFSRFVSVSRVENDSP
jgi:hypothetical protein